MSDRFKSMANLMQGCTRLDALNVVHVHIGLMLRVGSQVSQIISPAR